MSGSDLVTLKGGLTVPLPVLQIVWSLEDRGLHFRLDGDEIVVSPRELMTDDDRAALRRWKTDVRAILDYVPPEVA